MKPIISKITQTTTIDPNGRAIPGYQVNFSVGTHGPFSMQFSQADFTTQNVQQKLADFAAQITTLTPAN